MYREVTCKIGQLPEQAQTKAKHLLHRVGRILTQQPRDKRKLYALHAPKAECISKGKTRTPYEFGVKVSVATTLKEGLVSRHENFGADNGGWNITKSPCQSQKEPNCKPSRAKARTPRPR